MTGGNCCRRRDLLKALGAGLVGSAVPGGVGAASRSARQERDAIVETPTVHFDPDDSTAVYTFEYGPPDSDHAFTATFQSLSFYDFRQVRAAEGFERDGSTFVQDGDERPRVVLEDRLDSSAFEDRDRTFYREDEAFVPVVPRSALGWYGSGDRPPTVREPYTFDGEGYVNADMLYVGAHERATRTLDGEKLVVVVPRSAETDTEPADALEYFTEAHRLIGGTRLSWDEIACFVVPSREVNPDQILDGRVLAGLNIRGSFFVGDAFFEFDTVDNTPLHEYGHTVFGSFGNSDAKWLTEGLAEYYGYWLSLNLGIDDSATFFDTLRTDSRYESTTLTHGPTVENSVADYEKGAHVLGALDAEIQRRTDGPATLLDLFQLENASLTTHNWLKQTVVELADDPELGEWLDTHVDDDELPTLPEDPSYFRLGGRVVATDHDPRQPTVDHGDLLQVDTTVVNGGTEEAARTVELVVDGETLATTEVTLAVDDEANVAFDSVETAGLSVGTHPLHIAVDGVVRRRTQLTVRGDPVFEIRTFESTPASATADETVSFTADVTNVGSATGSTTAELFFGQASAFATPLAEISVTLDTDETETITFEGVRMDQFDPGEHEFSLSVVDDEAQTTVRVADSSDDEEPTLAATPGRDDTSGNETETVTPTAVTDSSDASGPGFGPGAVVAGLGGLGYFLRQRLDTSEPDM